MYSVNCLLELDFTLLDELSTLILLDFEALIQMKLCIYAFAVICVGVASLCLIYRIVHLDCLVHVTPVAHVIKHSSIVA